MIYLCIFRLFKRAFRSLKPKSMKESRRLTLAKNNLREIKRHARRMQNQVSVLEEKLNILEEQLNENKES